MNGATRQVPARQITGRTVLLGLVAFFAVVFAANIVFVWLANESWSGLSTEDAYRKGLAYNETLARADAQRALGWQASTDIRTRADGRHELVVTLREREGRPVDGRSVAATFRWPVTEGRDFTAPLVQVGPGEYRAVFTPPTLGQWNLRVEVARGDEAPFLIETRLWLK